MRQEVGGEGAPVVRGEPPRHAPPHEGRPRPAREEGGGEGVPRGRIYICLRSPVEEQRCGACQIAIII